MAGRVNNYIVLPMLVQLQRGAAPRALAQVANIPLFIPEFRTENYVMNYMVNTGLDTVFVIPVFSVKLVRGRITSDKKPYLEWIISQQGLVCRGAPELLKGA